MSPRNSAFLNEARTILRAGLSQSDRNSKLVESNATVVQPSYSLSSAPNGQIQPEIWALTIITLQGNETDIPLVEPFIHSDNPQIAALASNCLSKLTHGGVSNSPQESRVETEVGDGAADEDNGE